MRGNLLDGGRKAKAGRSPLSQGDAIGPCKDCVIAREADHRIANHLSMLAGIVRLKAANLAGGPSGAGASDGALVLEGIGVQIEMVARLHRALLAPGKALPDLSHHLHEICEPLVAALGGNVEFVADFEAGCFVRPDQVLALTQIVAEALTNAIKHASRSGDAGVIRANCRKDDAGAIRVEISDNGPGLPAGFDVGGDGGLGFRLMRALSKQLGAKIEFDSDAPGVRFRMTLPPPFPQPAD